nr:MAG TPA: hypothetical protein [Caudoviricetes sp.]
MKIAIRISNPKTKIKNLFTNSLLKTKFPFCECKTENQK